MSFLNDLDSSVNDPETQAANLRELVEGLLGSDDPLDAHPVLSRAEARALVLQAIEATWVLHQKTERNGEGFLSPLRYSHQQEKYDRIVRDACLALFRGK